MGSVNAGNVYIRIEVVVSNLLGSPASGEPKMQTSQMTASWGRFQFIGFPSEWGVCGGSGTVARRTTFPIYWVPQRVGSSWALPLTFGRFIVSNLLGSPASGEGKSLHPRIKLRPVSNLLGSPASGEVGAVVGPCGPKAFPIYWVPQRVGRYPY